MAAAEKLIPSTLELGGKSANIFFEDCDWEMAMDGLQMGILFNQGQGLLRRLPRIRPGRAFTTAS